MTPYNPIRPHLTALHALAVLRWDAGEQAIALRLWQQLCAVVDWLESLKDDRRYWYGHDYDTKVYLEALTMLGREREARAAVAEYNPKFPSLFESYTQHIQVALRRRHHIPGPDAMPRPQRMSVPGRVESALGAADWDRALALLAEVSPHALYEKHRAALRAKVAAALWQAEQTERAVGLLEQAEAEAQTILPSQRNETLHCIAEGWAVFDREQALRVYREAVETLQTIPERSRGGSVDHLILSLETSGFYGETPELLDEVPDWNERPAAHKASLYHGIKCVQQGPTPEALEDLTDALRSAIVALPSGPYEKTVQQSVRALLGASYLPFDLADMKRLREHQWSEPFVEYFCYLYESDQLPVEFRSLLPLKDAEQRAIWRSIPETSKNPERVVKFLKTLRPCLELAYTLARLERFEDALATVEQVMPEDYLREHTPTARSIIRIQASVGITLL
ncbi:hypothetical protein [Armatimonas rosea]|uniref:Tetratricopeptide repeat protein n=1 Tax=Armatimonas rosea TaxID=685828 RepID=A0A7W9W9Y8_ARMRO|nr:hypothetical protein [Armatimonas rosea]MBB6053730.1 hypothetical protein [Armatimonas rosea]